MKFDWRTELPSWTVLALLFVLAAVSWNTAPDQIPVHWGFGGTPDRWGGKGEGLLGLPFIALGLYFLMLFLPLIDPGRANYASFARTYAVIRLLPLLVLGAVYVAILLTIRGYHVDMMTIAPLAVGATFVVIGNMFGKIRPNWFVGIRTPWTLSSKESWTRTHRLGGWVFMALGLLIMTCAVVRAAAYAVALATVFALSMGALLWYSYFVWKNDPDKQPPAGTLPAEPRS